MYPLSQWVFNRGYQYYSEGIAGLGAGILYLSVWAGWHYYHIFPQSYAFPVDDRDYRSHCRGCHRPRFRAHRGAGPRGRIADAIAGEHRRKRRGRALQLPDRARRRNAGHRVGAEVEMDCAAAVRRDASLFLGMVCRILRPLRARQYGLVRHRVFCGVCSASGSAQHARRRAFGRRHRDRSHERISILDRASADAVARIPLGTYAGGAGARRGTPAGGTRFASQGHAGKSNGEDDLCGARAHVRDAGDSDSSRRQVDHDCFRRRRRAADLERPADSIAGFAHGRFCAVRNRRGPRWRSWSSPLRLRTRFS